MAKRRSTCLHCGSPYVFTTRIRLRNGRILHASEVGKKCFAFPGCKCKK